MAEVLLAVRDKATKPLRDMLKRQGLKLVEVRCYAVKREDDGAELCRGTLDDDVAKWVFRQMREGKL
jgi:uroporphyrinogen-III synthase